MQLSNYKTWLLIAAYLGAVVSANVAVASYGAAALPVTAFLLIPFDLVARDVLHERWARRFVCTHIGMTWPDKKYVLLHKSAAVGISETSPVVLRSGRDYFGGVWAKMAVLIAAGSALSFAVAPSAGRVALASAVAFSVASTVDALVYHVCCYLSRFRRMNLSNMASALTDSLLFPLVAFGSMTYSVFVAQSGAKFIGGLFWSLLFVGVLRRRQKCTA